MAGTEVKLANRSTSSGLEAGHLGRKRQSELSARSVTSSVRDTDRTKSLVHY